MKIPKNNYFFMVGVLAFMYVSIYEIPYYIMFLNYKELFLISNLLKGLLSAFLLITAWFLLVVFSKKLFYLSTFLFFLVPAPILFYMKTQKITLSGDLLLAVYYVNRAEFEGYAEMRVVVLSILSLLLGAVFIFWRNKLQIQKPLKKYYITAVILIIPAAATSLKYTAPLPFEFYEKAYRAVEQEIITSKAIKNKKDISALYDFTSENISDNHTVVIILGESVRGDHIYMNGYQRLTTPYMLEKGAVSFSKALSCDWLTQKSVPCMLTRGTIRDMSQSINETSIISIYKKLGYKTAWISNQGSLYNTNRPILSILKTSDEIFFCNTLEFKWEKVNSDLCMLPAIDDFLEQEGKKLLIVHTFGSHGKYEDRYDKEFEYFVPVCGDTPVSQCSREALINAYDNSILVTDTLFNHIAEQVLQTDAIIVYASDHGEGLYEEDIGRNRHIGFTVWYTDSYEQKFPIGSNLIKNKDRPVGHDNLFHSILHCSGIHSEIIDESQSICSGNYTDYIDPFIKWDNLNN